MSRNPLPRPESSLRASVPACQVCGCGEVVLDEVSHGASRLELGECPRCDHRWTRSLPARASQGGRALAISPPASSQPLALPNAA